MNTVCSKANVIHLVNGEFTAPRTILTSTNYLMIIKDNEEKVSFKIRVLRNYRRFLQKLFWWVFTSQIRKSIKMHLASLSCPSLKSGNVPILELTYLNSTNAYNFFRNMLKILHLIMLASKQRNRQLYSAQCSPSDNLVGLFWGNFLKHKEGNLTLPGRKVLPS